MAWNQPGNDSNKPATRGAPEDSPLAVALRRLQRRLQSLLRPGGNGAAVVAALLLLIALVWLASGFYEIEPAERGVVQRFGRYVGTEEPGRGWHWPAPIETLTKVNVSAINSIDSRSAMLTADLDLLSVGWTVQYRLSDPLKYLFEFRDTEATLRASAQSAVRALIGRTTMDAALTGDGRSRITTDARELLQKTLDRRDSGISVANVSLVDVQVPDAVLAARRDVSKAVEDGNHARQEAQAYANDVLPKAQSTAQRQLQDAQAYKAQVIAAADGDAQRFSQVAAIYAQAPEVTRSRLYIETVEAVLARSRKIIIDTRAAAGGNMIYLPLDKLLEATRSAGAAQPPAVPVAVSPGNPAAGATAAATGAVTTAASGAAGSAAAANERPAVVGSSDAASADSSADGSEGRSRERGER